ncbi:signal peptidase II [bacterium]|nr:signal peptidase II [bacterium]
MRLRSLVAVAILVTVFDQLSKYYVRSHFQLGETRPALDTVLSWTYLHNRGGAFSILNGARWFFLVAGGIVSGLLLRALPRMAQGHPVPALAYALILGGAIGNLIDRGCYGYVIDFIDFHWWPVFNLADSAITVGITLLSLSILLGKDQPPK